VSAFSYPTIVVEFVEEPGNKTPKALASCSPGQRPGRKLALHVPGIMRTLSKVTKIKFDFNPGRCPGLPLANAFGVTH